MNTKPFILHTIPADPSEGVKYVARRLSDTFDSKSFYLSGYKKDAYEFDKTADPDLTMYNLERHCHFVNLKPEYIT